MLKNVLNWLLNLITPTIGPNKTVKTSEIEKWLATDQDRTWKAEREEPNYFVSSDQKAIYIYDNIVEYWENLRDLDNVSEFAIPRSRAELFLMF